MSCETLSDKLTGYLDGELDSRAAGEVESHLRQCVSCATRLERERRLRHAVQAQLKPLEAPDRLRDRLRAAIRDEVTSAPHEVTPAPRRTAWIPVWAATAAALVLGLAGGWQLATLRGARGETAELATEVIAGHVRSLQGGHLTDIGSSEHHTVKPWFAGKLDFSPPVPDFSAQGFPLTGGRLDYLAERQVAALVYHRRQHVINLFVWPSSEASSAPTTVSRRGYQMVHGNAGGMTYWAISDLNAAELEQFARMTADELSGRPGPRQ